MHFPTLSFGKVLAGTAVVLAVTTTTTYAVATVTSADIVDGTIKSVDVGNGTLKTADILNETIGAIDIAPGAVTSSELLDGTITSGDVADGTLTAADLGNGSVGVSEIATDGVGASEIQDNSIDSGEIADFSLSNQDIGVLFAQVDAGGGLDASAGGTVTATRVGAVGAGTYEVDFGRNVSACAFIASLGNSTTTTQSGQISAVDRGGDVNAVFVETNDSAGVSADRAFQLVVVC